MSKNKLFSSLKLTNGIVLKADFLVAGIGVEPNNGLALLAGLTIEQETGRTVVVDDKQQTSNPHIFVLVMQA